MTLPPSNITLLESPRWRDYALLDSGGGQKLERFGPYTLIRPEVQAMWSRALPEKDWNAAHAVFQPSGEESGGHWEFRKKVAERWEMRYPLELEVEGGQIADRTKGRGEAITPSSSPKGRGELRFIAQTTPGRHLGVFPECAAHWDWMYALIAAAGRPIRALNLFGYTGLASLACAAAGAQVTHVDASKKSVAWARENQRLSGLEDTPIRRIVDDALKFVQREARRGAKYDGIYLDPPKFGRGPKGEVWEVYKSLPELLQACRAVLSDQPLFLAVTVYAVKASALHVAQALQEITRGLKGRLDCGELVTREESAARLLSQAVYARWERG